MANALGTTVAALLEDPPRWFAPFAVRRSAGEPADLPTAAQVAGASARLLGSAPDALAYLTDDRGIALDVIERFEVGWGEEPRGRSALIFPMRDAAGAVVAAKWRFPYAAAQIRSWPGDGRAWPLYPRLERDWYWLLLVAGELDALRARSAGLPAASVTLGAGCWRDEWTKALGRYRRVLVAFDNNEQPQARLRARQLREAGVRAHRLDLRTLGLRTPKGDLSDYLNGGGSPAAIRQAAFNSRTRVILRRGKDDQ